MSPISVSGWACRPRVPDVLSRYVGPLVERLLARNGLDCRRRRRLGGPPGRSPHPRRRGANSWACPGRPSRRPAPGWPSTATAPRRRYCMILDRLLRQRGRRRRPLMLLAFGPGLTLYGALLERPEPGGLTRDAGQLRSGESSGESPRWPCAVRATRDSTAWPRSAGSGCQWPQPPGVTEGSDAAGSAVSAGRRRPIERWSPAGAARRRSVMSRSHAAAVDHEHHGRQQSRAGRVGRRRAGSALGRPRDASAVGGAGTRRPAADPAIAPRSPRTS